MDTAARAGEPALREAAVERQDKGPTPGGPLAAQPRVRAREAQVVRMLELAAAPRASQASVGMRAQAELPSAGPLAKRWESEAVVVESVPVVLSAPVVSLPRAVSSVLVASSRRAASRAPVVLEAEVKPEVLPAAEVRPAP